MRYKVFLIFLSCILLGIQAKLLEYEIRLFLRHTYERNASAGCYKINKAGYDFYTDIANETKKELYENATLEYAEWERDIWKEYFENINPYYYKDPLLRRQIQKLRVLGEFALEQDKLEELTNTKTEMTEIFNTAKICPYSNQYCDLTEEGLDLYPELEDIMAKSTNYDELVYVWKAWRDASGAKMKELYPTYVTLSNEAARANGFDDMGELWKNDYENPDFEADIDALWTQVEPLYTELHQYVARKLKDRYGDKLDISDGLVPAHVFGNMWAESWTKIADLVRPFPELIRVNLTAALKEKKFTINDLFTTADFFYQSLGMPKMDMAYNESAGAVILKPTDGRDVFCHPSSWDFCDRKTFRLLMCTQFSYEDFLTIHHELGHIQYFMQYKNIAITFRDGADPAFHEAIGDTIGLSVNSAAHLEKIGLLKYHKDTDKHTINYLMDIALEKIAFLPFGLLIDKWRWDVFKGRVDEHNFNKIWWKYRMEYQKVKAPVMRSDKTDFDPGAKVHVAEDSQYISYFLAHIYQFQFYRSLCIVSEEYNPVTLIRPLHNCDFFLSSAAGEVLMKTMRVGSTLHWSETLEIMTGSKMATAEPLLEYFGPLYNFLKRENGKYDNYLKFKPKFKKNLCTLEWKGQMLQNFKLGNDPPFACIQKHTANMAWCR